MRIFFFPAAIGALVAAAALTTSAHRLSPASFALAPHPKLVWSDEFNGSAGSLPDPSQWTIVTGGGGYGNRELETYTARPEIVQQHDGNLVITARQESFTGSDNLQRDFTSARLQTKNHFAQAYGRFEARMKLPAGKGIWPAFWLLGNNADTAPWPVCGEIDVMETIGDPHTMYSTLHGPGFSGNKAISAKFALPAGQAVDTAFHVYALDWTPARIRFLYDDQLIVERSPKDLPPGAQWVYDHPFFVLLDLAVGGNWPGSPNEKTSFPQSLLVDYVRVYETNFH